MQKNILKKSNNHSRLKTLNSLEIIRTYLNIIKALGSITMNKDSGGDGIPVGLFQILKDVAVKVLTQYASKFEKLSSGQRTGKVSFHPNPKQRQCQGMLKLWHNCTHLTC